MLVTVVLVVGITACGGAGGGVGSSGPVGDVQETVVPTATIVKRSTRPPQDDDYIHTYGYEATGVERRAITRLVKRYYAAAAADDGAIACSLLDRSVAKSIPEDYGQTPTNSGKTCAEVMSKVFRHLADQPHAVLAHTSVTGIRLRGDRGFVQLHSSTMPTGEIALEREGAGWKVAVLVGRSCKNCAPG